MTTFQFPVKYLKAAMIVAGKQDIRYYLNGVLLERHGKGVVAVATDGHRLIACYQDGPYGNGDFPDFAPVILPRELVESIVKAHDTKHGVECITVELEGEGEKRNVTLSSVYGSKFTQAEVEGRYPQWQKVIPAYDRAYTAARRVTSEKVCGKWVETLGDPMGFNAEYLGDFAKVRKALSDRPARANTSISIITHDGGAARVDVCDPNVIAVLMPTVMGALTRSVWFDGAESSPELEKVAA